ncbi:hypothetical protein EIP86_001512 [Pleurotus ostreatoroseus]|nr:hypothetical protein EIP86_001512 [Pleurotus ostreatoroseus]
MWACYEQIPFEDDYSDSASDDGSCSEDDEDYPGRAPGCGHAHEHGSDASDEPPRAHGDGGDGDGDMELDERDEAMSAEKIAALRKDVKGKQRAIEPEMESASPPPKRQHRKKHREPTYTLRPILTIQRSQGFVWNQVSCGCV